MDVLPSPAVTVLIPVYNGGQFLDAALQSVAQQTFQDFEVIVSDDNSTDDSAAIAERWAARDQRFRLIENPGPHGLPNNLNFGLRHTRGELVARMDQDDLCRPGRLERQVHFFRNHPEISLLGASYQPFGIHGTRQGIQHPRNSVYLAWKCLANSYFAHPTVMFRRCVIEQIGLYPLQEAEDFGFFSNILHSFRATNLTDTVLDYREHNGNMSTVRREAIAKEVERTFLHNYEFYLDSRSGAEDYHLFQVGKWLPLSKLPTIYRQSWQVVQKIRRAYRLPWWGLEFLGGWARVKRDILASALRALFGLRPLTKHIRI